MPTLQWLNREAALGGADAAPYRLLVEEAVEAAVRTPKPCLGAE